MKNLNYISSSCDLEIINEIPILIIIIDINNWEIQWCNPYMEKRLGYSFEEMQQMNSRIFQVLMPPEDYKNTLQIQDFLLSDRKCHTSICRLRSKNEEVMNWFWGYAYINEKDEHEMAKTLLYLFQEFPQKIDTPKQAIQAFRDIRYAFNKSIWVDLNGRQINVLKLLKEGYTAPGIAKKLLVSTATVKLDLQKLFEKFHVHTAVALIAIVVELGL